MSITNGTGHGEKLSRKREQAIAALLAEPTLAAAAGALGVSDRTLRNWLKRSTFRAAYREARRQVVEGAIARLQQATTDAVACLQRNLTCEHAATEVRAALGASPAKA